MIGVAILLSGCGGSSASEESAPTTTASSPSSATPTGSRSLTAYMAKAADVTAQQGGARISMTGTASAAGADVTFVGEGLTDLAANKGRLTMHFDAAGQSGDIEIVYEGFIFYLSSKLFGKGQLPGGATWMKLDLKKSSEAAGLDASAWQSANPGDTLSSLRASGEVTRLGKEQVRGVETTHYRAVMDPEKLKSYSKIAEKYDTESSPTEVWIDAQNRVRRMKTEYAYTSPGQGRVSQTFTMEMFDYGTPATIEVPAEDDVFDATDIASKALKEAK